MTLHGIEIPQEQIAAFCRENGVRRLALFGSILREDFRPDSDIDVLVEFQPGVRVGYLTMARMARDFPDVMGRAVDMRTPAELHPAFRDEVIKGALTEYVAA